MGKSLIEDRPQSQESYRVAGSDKPMMRLYEMRQGNEAKKWPWGNYYFYLPDEVSQEDFDECADYLFGKIQLSDLNYADPLYIAPVEFINVPGLAGSTRFEKEWGKKRLVFGKNYTFPKDYHLPRLQGKTVKIYHKVRPMTRKEMQIKKSSNLPGYEILWENSKRRAEKEHKAAEARSAARWEKPPKR